MNIKIFPNVQRRVLLPPVVSCSPRMKILVVTVRYRQCGHQAPRPLVRLRPKEYPPGCSRRSRCHPSRNLLRSVRRTESTEPAVKAPPSPGFGRRFTCPAEQLLMLDLIYGTATGLSGLSTA
jgi:hypothetical protein